MKHANRIVKQTQRKSFYYLNQNFPIDDKLWRNISEKRKVCFLKEIYEINPTTKKITLINAKNIEVPNSFYPILLNYLNKEKNLTELNSKPNFISPKFREDWTLFFRAVHSLKEELVLTAIKGIEDLKTICNFFNGKLLEYADFSFYVEPLKGIKIAYLYWKGDEDFPPSLTILFDEVLPRFFMQDFVWGVIVETNSRIKNFKEYSKIFIN